MNPDVIIVGGGIAGLTAALRLRDSGLRPVVLEASARVGGTICTEEVDGLLVERGPQSIRGAGAATARLIRDVGLLSKVVPAAVTSRRRYLYHRGSLQPLPDGPLGLLSGGLVPRGVALRALREPLVRRGWTSGETVDSFVRRRFGPGVTEALVDAMVGGIFAGDPAQLEVESAFPTLFEAERTHGSVLVGMMRNRRRTDDIEMTRGPFSFDQGLEMLPRAIAGELGDAVRLRAPVREISPTDQGVSVRLDDEVLMAGAVVVAVPPPVATGLVPQWAGMGRTPTHAPVATVHLGWPSGTGPPMDGFGWLTPSTERQDCLGVIWVSETFPHLAPGFDVVRVMIGGTRAPQLATLSDRALMHHAMDVVCRVQGVVPEPSLVHVASHRPGIPQYTPGHADYLRRIRARVPSIHPIGWGFTGVGLTQVIAEGEAVAARISESP